MVTGGEYECFHQFQRGILLDSWLSLMSTLVNPRRSPEASLEEYRSDGCIWRSLQSGPLSSFKSTRSPGNMAKWLSG
jgi:hypothetical protein